MATMSGDMGGYAPLDVDVVNAGGHLVDTTAAALEEKKKLQRHFWALRHALLPDLHAGGPGYDRLRGQRWRAGLIFLALTFFIPYALLTAELGSTFVDEGGPYVWTRLAFGRFVAAVNALLYWVSNPIWLGGSLTILAVTTFGKFFTPLNGVWQYVFALIFIWFAVVAAILSFGIGKWIPTVGAWGRIVVLGFFTLTVLLYAIQHGIHGLGASAFGPTYVAFIAVVPVLVFNYVGFELPNAAGDEMKDPQRDVPFTVARSAIGAVLLYGVPILAILLVLPQSQVTGLGGFLDAAKTVFTVYGGHVASSGAVTLTGMGQVLGDVAALFFIWALASSGTTWIMGADRAMAVAAFDGAAPRIMGTFSSRFGTPVIVNLLTGIMSTLVMVLATLLTSRDSGKYFAAVLGLAISTTTISYLAIFPALIKLRYSHAHVQRPYRIPFGSVGAWVCGAVTTFWALLATVGLLWPGFGTGWFGSVGNPDDALTGLSFAHQRFQYEVSQFVPLIVFFAIGVWFYVLGAQTRAQTAPAALAETQGGVLAR